MATMTATTMEAAEAYETGIRVSRAVGYRVRVVIGRGEGRYEAVGSWATMPFGELDAESGYCHNWYHIRELIYDAASKKLWAMCQIRSADGRWLVRETRRGRTVTVLDRSTETV